MLKYFKHLSIRLFFVLLGILLLLTAWSLVYAKQHISLLLTASLLVLSALAWWLARSISRIRRYAEAMAANRTAVKPQFGDSYLYRLVNAVAHLREELDHRQHIENYVLGLTHELKTPLTAQQAALELLSRRRTFAGAATTGCPHCPQHAKTKATDCPSAGTGAAGKPRQPANGTNSRFSRIIRQGRRRMPRRAPYQKFANRIGLPSKTPRTGRSLAHPPSCRQSAVQRHRLRRRTQRNQNQPCRKQQID